jgi:hypothetical protein
MESIQRFHTFYVASHMCLDFLSTQDQDFQLCLVGGPAPSPSSGELFLDTEYHVEMMTNQVVNENIDTTI